MFALILMPGESISRQKSRVKEKPLFVIPTEIDNEFIHLLSL